MIRTIGAVFGIVALQLILAVSWASAEQEAVASTIKVGSPNGGERFVQGDTVTVTWELNATATVNSIEIRLLSQSDKGKRPESVKTLLELNHSGGEATVWDLSAEQSLCLIMTKKGSSFVYDGNKWVPKAASISFSCPLHEVLPSGDHLRIEVVAYSGKTVIAADQSDQEFVVLEAPTESSTE